MRDLFLQLPPLARQRPPPSGGPRLVLQPITLGTKRRHAVELRLDVPQPPPRVHRLGELAVESPELPPSLEHIPLRHPSLAVEGQHRFSELDHPLPGRLLVRQSPLRLRVRPLGGLERRLRFRHPSGRLITLACQLVGIGQPPLEAGDLATQLRPASPQLVLRQAELLVAQHAGEEPCPLGGTHRRHDRQFLLPGEIRVEELVPRHPQHALHARAHFLLAVGDGFVESILIQFGVVQPAHDAELVGAQGEFHFGADGGARRGAIPANAVPAPTGGRVAVERPRHGFEQRALAGPVGSDDRGDPRSQRDVGVIVLAEVDQLHATQLHSLLEGVLLHGFHVRSPQGQQRLAIHVGRQRTAAQIIRHDVH